MAILASVIGILFFTNIMVCILVVRSAFYSLGQKMAQCALVWFVPVIGVLGVWAFLRSQYKWERYDTRAYPEYSEKMVNVEIANEIHDHLDYPDGHSGVD